MVRLSFHRDTTPLLHLQIHADGRIEAAGDASWLDLDFTPTSSRTGQPVRFHDDPLEWARSLPAAYAGTAMTCTVTEDSGGPPLPPPPPQPDPASAAPAEGMEEMSMAGTLRRRARRRRAIRGAVIAAVLTFCGGGAALATGKAHLPVLGAPSAEQLTDRSVAALKKWGQQDDASVRLNMQASAGADLTDDAPPPAKLLAASPVEVTLNGVVSSRKFDATLAAQFMGESETLGMRALGDPMRTFLKFDDRWYDLTGYASAGSDNTSDPLNDDAITEALLSMRDLRVNYGPDLDGQQTWKLTGHPTFEDAVTLTEQQRAKLSDDTEVEYIVGRDDYLPRRVSVRIDTELKTLVGDDSLPVDFIEQVRLQASADLSDYDQPVKVTAPRDAGSAIELQRAAKRRFSETFPTAPPSDPPPGGVPLVAVPLDGSASQS